MPETLLHRSLFPLLLLVFSLNGYARVCSPSTQIKEENVQYLTNLIESLNAANEALVAVREMGATPSNSSMMLTLKRAADGFECAATLIGVYGTSKDRSVHVSAAANLLAYNSLLAGAKGLLASIKDQLNGVPIKQGDLLDKLTDFSLNADKAWKLFLNAIPAATYAAIVWPANDDALLTTLNMSRAQRDDLLEALSTDFGTVVKTPKDNRNSLSQPELAAWFLYDFLNKDEWKFAG